MIEAGVMITVLNSLMAHRELIQSALDRQVGEGFTFQHVFDLVKNEQALFFWNKTSCAVIEIRKYPGETNLHVFLGAGTTEGLLELYEHVASWGGKVVGATKMTTLCRKGFKRTLAKHGWKESQVWLTKQIGISKEAVQ
jgi:hypothetical protein